MIMFLNLINNTQMGNNKYIFMSTLYYYTHKRMLPYLLLYLFLVFLPHPLHRLQKKKLEKNVYLSVSPHHHFFFGLI